MKRFVIALLTSLLTASLVFAVVTALSPAPKAHAATVLACTIGTEAINYDPGLKNQSQTVHVTVNGDYDLCTALSAPTLTSGDGGFSYTTTADCLVALTLPNITITYHWNNGTSSTINFSHVVVRLADGTTQVTGTGPVTAGFGAGSIATRITVLPQLSVTQCASSQGVTQLSGPSTLVFA